MDGCLRLFDLPPPEQAVLIRKAIGLKRRKRHPGNLSHLKFTTATRGVSASPASVEGKGGVLAIPKLSSKKLARTPRLPRSQMTTTATTDNVSSKARDGGRPIIGEARLIGFEAQRLSFGFLRTSP